MEKPPFSKRPRADAAFRAEALRRALLAQRLAPGPIVHSDRGGQYVGKACKSLLHHAQARLSYSRRAECYANAQAESHWSRLKTEELAARDWPHLAQSGGVKAMSFARVSILLCPTASN